MLNPTAFLWNETWVAREHVGWVVGLLASTLALYAGSVTLVVFLYQWWTYRIDSTRPNEYGFAADYGGVQATTTSDSEEED